MTTADEILAARDAARLLRGDGGLIYWLLEFLARQPRGRTDVTTATLLVAEELGWASFGKGGYLIDGPTADQTAQLQAALALARRRGLIRADGYRHLPTGRRGRASRYVERCVCLTDAGYRALAAEMLEETSK